MKSCIRKIFLVSIAVFLLCQLLFSLVLAEDIKIAFVGPFTGLGSAVGDVDKKAVLLAVDDINATGGINGEKIDLIIYDDGGDPSNAVNVVKRAVFNDKVKVLWGPQGSSCVLATHMIAKENKIPMLTGATSPAFGYTKAGNDYLFRLRADDNVKVAQLVKYAVENLKIEKPGIIYGSTDYCTDALDVAKSTFDKYGINITGMEQMREGEKDATGQILSLKKAGIDGIIGLTHDPEAAVVVKLIRQLQIDVPIIGFSAWGVPTFTDLAGDAAIGVYAVQGFNATDPDPIVQNFVEKHRQKWGGSEPVDPAQAVYDGVYLTVEAIKLAGSTDGQEIAKALTEVTHTGVQGPLKCDEDHNFTKLCYISQFDGNKWNIIDKLR